MKSLAEAIGHTLRDARKRRGLTLHDTTSLSGGRYKASAVGGYERGERSISLQRFCELAELYGESPDRLLAEAFDGLSPGRGDDVVIDLTRLPLVKEEEGRVVAQYVYELKSRRGDYEGEVITLRSGDLDALALRSRMKPRVLRQKLSPALRGPR